LDRGTLRVLLRAWRIQGRSQWGLKISAGDRRAIVGGYAGTIVGYDLEKMVTPMTASVDEMIQLAELAAGRRIMSEGNVVPITSAEWADRWEQLRRAEGAHSETPSTTSPTHRAGP
jgi:hypothetical protein